MDAKTTAQTTKVTFEKLADNQNQLLNKLSQNANTAFDLMQPDKATLETGQALVQQYFERSRALAEEMMQPENFDRYYEKMPAYFNKALTINTDFFNQTVDFMRNMYQTYSVERLQEQARKYAELTQDNMNALLETVDANMKVVQESVN